MRRPSPLIGVLFVACLAFAVRVHADLPADGAGDSDSAAEKPGSPPPWVFEKGMRVRLLLRDGSHASGEVSEIATMSPVEYRSRYAAWRDTAAIGRLLPALDDTLRVVRKGKTFDRTFAGFGPGGLYVRHHPGEKPTLIEYEQLTSVAVPGGESVAIGDLMRLESANDLPSPRVIVLISEHEAFMGRMDAKTHDTTMVMVDDIERVEEARGKGPGHIIAGFLIAAGFVALAVLAIDSCNKTSEPNCDPGPVPTLFDVPDPGASTAIPPPLHS